MTIKAKTKSQRNRKSVLRRVEQHEGCGSSIERALRLAALLNKQVLPWAKLLMPLIIILLWTHLPEAMRKEMHDVLKATGQLTADVRGV